ncbi:MAG: tetratricopeptide repeat protein [Acidobacteriota bacterium]
MSNLKIKFVLMWVAAALCAAPFAFAQAKEAQQIFTRAMELHQAGNLEAAAEEYKKFLTLYPKVIEARSNLGAVYARLGRFNEAIEEYKKALTIDKQNAGVRFNLAVAYYKSAQYTEAASELEKLVSADAVVQNPLLLLADCRLRLGEYKKVIALLSPYESSASENLTIAYLLGTAYIRDHQPDKGQVLIDYILRKGESAEARLLMGSAYLMIRDYPGAAKEFARAIALNPQLPTANSMHGQALLGAGERESAMKAFTAELAINPNDFEANLYSGMLLKEDQKYEEALKFLQKALSVRSRELNVIYFIANVNMSLGKTVEAQRMLEDIIKQAPDFVEAHVLLATVYYRLKRKVDGDRERAIIQKLNAERQSKAPGAKEGLGPAYRGETLPETRKPDKPEEKKPF